MGHAPAVPLSPHARQNALGHSAGPRVVVLPWAALMTPVRALGLRAVRFGVLCWAIGQTHYTLAHENPDGRAGLLAMSVAANLLIIRP